MVQWETLQPYAIEVSAVSALGVSAYKPIDSLQDLGRHEFDKHHLMISES